MKSEIKMVKKSGGRGMIFYLHGIVIYNGIYLKEIEKKSLKKKEVEKKSYFQISLYSSIVFDQISSLLIRYIAFAIFS